MKHLKQCLAHCELSNKILKMNVNVTTKCQMQNTLTWRTGEVMIELIQEKKLFFPWLNYLLFTSCLSNYISGHGKIYQTQETVNINYTNEIT